MIKKLAPYLITILSVAVLAGELYSRFPDGKVKAENLTSRGDDKEIIILFHGSGGQGKPVFQEIADALKAQQPEALVVNYDWSLGSENRFRAMANGQSLGRQLGEQIAGQSNIKSVTMIAHSVGASIPDALCLSLREKRSDSVKIETIFLDPFGWMGLFDMGYGARNYGECADFAVAYINTDDPVPTTNDPLTHAQNINVTEVPGKASGGDGDHYWPVYFFRNLLKESKATDMGESHQKYPKGQFRPSNSSKGWQPVSGVTGLAPEMECCRGHKTPSRHTDCID